MSAASIYEFLPLLRDRLSTRALTLLPDSHEDDIQCELRVIDINACSDYEALSYTWGNPDDRRVTEVKSRRLKVSKNLEQAIRQLRFRTKKRKLWVDAVCIDQGNVGEKEAQAVEMGQLYRNATRVLIWLGPRCAEHPERDAFREDLPHILQRRLWTRIWVVQELVLAAAGPLVICGNCSVPWSKLARLADIPQSHTIHHLRTARELARCPPRLRGWNGTEGLRARLEDSLLDWLIRRTRFEATEPLDKVYAIMPLARNRTEAAFEVEYSLTPASLLEKLMYHAINHQQNLDLLVYCNSKNTNGHNSWIPTPQ